MKDTLINFETAILAKEKGFNIEQLKGFWFNSKFHKDGQEIEFLQDVKNSKILRLRESETFEIGNPFVYRPTQFLLAKWLREVHKINVYCSPCQHDENLWYNNIASHIPVFTGKYEEALELGLYQALLLINP